jgi:hypothetical protein
MVLGLFKKTPKLEASFRPTVAVARELTREIEVAGELVLRNVGRDAELTDLELVLIGGGTRRIDLSVPEAWRGGVSVPASGELRQQVAWKLTLAAPMRAPAAEIQVNTTAGGKHQPLAVTPAFPLANE